MSSNLGGMRSSVNGTWGSIDMMDIVRKSSGMTSGAVILEIDLAAYLRAFRDAVKLDLNVNLRGGIDGSVLSSWTSVLIGFPNTIELSSSVSISGPDSGWSDVISPGGDERTCSLRLGVDLFPREPGVARDP